MDTSAELRISRWSTLISDLEHLYFVSLLDQGNTLRFTVEDESKHQYEIIAEHSGLYRVADEQFLVHYWGASEEGRGWTFRVAGADWLSDIVTLDLYAPKVEHYVVATWDVCLEVLTSKEPRIRKL